MSKFDDGGPMLAAIHEAAQTGSDEQLWESLDELTTKDLRSLLLCKFRAMDEIRIWHDYAAAALQGFIASNVKTSGESENRPATIAIACGMHADAMLAERRKRFQGEQE